MDMFISNLIRYCEIVHVYHVDNYKLKSIVYKAEARNYLFENILRSFCFTILMNQANILR